jgi:uncharacterized protein YqgC (DUF456 family)
MDWQVIIAILLVVIGIAGTILPMLPGVPLVFAGLLLAAWTDGFDKVSILTIVIIGVIATMAWAVDFFASIVTAKKVGASKYALWGAGIGAIIGIAKKQGLISSAREAFEVLHSSDFRISATVINQVLVSVNE